MSDDQREVIEEAKIEAGPSGRVHIFGRPVKHLEEGDRFCGQPSTGVPVEVIFHPDFVELTAGGYVCLNEACDALCFDHVGDA